MTPWKAIVLSPYEVLYGFPYLTSVIDVPTFENKDFSSKIIYLDCPLPYFLLGKKSIASASSST
jgi:hypothetical protein